MKVDILLGVLCLCLFAVACGGNMNLTENKAIEIANKAAENLGYDVKAMNMTVNKYTTPWNEYLPESSESQYIVERRKKLVNREYWAVYFHHARKIKGGDIAIFIDSKNGEVITDYRGK